MRDLHSNVVCAAVLVYSVLSCSVALPQAAGYTTRAGFDAEGNIFVSSDNGKLIKVAGPHDCGEAVIAYDRQTVLCMATRSMEERSQPIKLEIFQRNGLKKTLEPGFPIAEWHFWNDGRQIAVSSRLQAAAKSYALYDVYDLHLIEKVTAITDGSPIPQWAKTRTQISDESIPKSDALSQERTMWVAKVMRQIDAVKPGMRRKDLAPTLTTEGGFYSRLSRTYVSAECPFIKVDVQLKTGSGNSNETEESPEDIIELISHPYLAWSVTD
jgi:hypothetical protein